MNQINFTYLEPKVRDTMFDLAVMVHSEVFVGTCSSTFSAFVSRYRRFNDVGIFGEKRKGRNPNYYFGMIEDDFVKARNNENINYKNDEL